MDKRITYSVVGVLVLLVLAFGIYSFVGDSKIEKANISTFAYLEEVLDCGTVIDLKIGTGRIVSEFKDDGCYESALENLKEIPFGVGELEPGELILESEEFSSCSALYAEGGAVDYKICIREMLPLLEEKYPEVA
jgi:hypothetical protein